MRHATLCFIVDSGKVLLGMKKRGFGEGKYNGFGGKKKENEKIHETAVRELKEESGIITNLADIEKMAELHFSFPVKKEWDQTVHVYVVNKWEGDPKESEEMRPEWFDVSKIPFDNMWSDDTHWLPLILKGKKIEAHFNFKEDNQSINNFKIKEL